MRNFDCRCGAALFFHSEQCVRCKSATAMCANCRQVAAVDDLNDGTVQCSNCGTHMRFCGNRVQNAICNGGVRAESADALCRYCSLNQIVPDLSMPGNREKWLSIERAKHRVLYDVDRIGFPIITDAGDGRAILRFEFKSSTAEPVTTGHTSGLITMNIAEADSVQREQTRVQFGEPQRTLVGHFRHELGHYFWDVCVNPSRLDEYRQLFGDERNPDYVTAQQQYYSGGPPDDWWTTYVSEYATMHSWEDFAETFNAYLDMIAIVGTSAHFHRLRVDADVDGGDFQQLLTAYQDIGIVANELNRDMGMLDLVPEVFTPPVVQKMRFVHSLRVQPCPQP
ncbi:hypothetical protein FYK55_24995 [Roseiconus nitratireducens]|uniref:Zinc-ribbon domain-containing protein n=1 Tax=Roseiconus nitratireducens TaxID=2605748 RepID=A0A5M6CXP3_9BACT|nr:putative zinc-binding metallopeptidase [Roseiconus nitratireducens]KAA5539180.1 hypothetical protein FYK55_24995 [Roseiconus nitratireducens]